MPNTMTAYSVYTYTGGASGMAGRISDTGSAVTPIPNLKTGLNGDPQVEGFATSATALRIAVTDYAGTTDRPTSIYNAFGAPGALPLATQTWAAVDNQYGLVMVGSYLYALDYDNARIVEINPGTYVPTGVSYTLAAGLIPSGYTPHGQAIIEIGGALYGLFTFANSAWTAYAPSLLVRFTIVGGTSIMVGVNDANNGLEKNGFALAVNGTDLYVASLGGRQIAGTPNPNSKLQSIPYGAANLSTATVTTVMTPSVTYPYEFRDISFDASGTAYVLMGAYTSAWLMAGKLLKTTNFTTFTTVNDFSAGVAGYFWAAQYTGDNNRIWLARGNSILVYNAASIATPVSTLTITAGSLKTSGQAYDSLNDMSYVGAAGTTTRIRGYRSPTQASRSARGLQARAIAQGRPELTDDELLQLESSLNP